MSAAAVVTDGAVTSRPLDDEPFLLEVRAHEPGLALDAWIAGRREELRAGLDRYGALLLRGFDVPDPEAFGRAARAVSPELLGYLERAATRTEVADKVFTSTELSADQWIPFHHEMSYSHNWPSLLYFYGDLPSPVGGATPVASERTVLPRIPADVRERFERHGVRYVRNYGPDLDQPWQEVFQTTDRAEVEAYCRQSGTDFEWTADDGLRTSAVRQAVSRHPRTGETVWFNHAHLFHVSNMPPEVAEVLVEEYGVEGLPRNAYYGDGEPIEDEVADLIRGLYREASVSFPWERSDVLIVDNFLAAHARAPFTGDRRILVAMSDLHTDGVPGR
ncbi:TauD/TfdA family dioxygenase [Streptomyces sp. WAC05374]|uniref:TauD/TfdA family dioxygenase n=1 Tax=Streptomyces sp. WAC05374 TaxID=2487420 RepID=UPI000F891869|nr:TauD/TfdA family dioxygenase [Streptomyces sp. WAC05374]RST18334.1 TauD/TfdA family dioxygenase [Streptomyces sp. WAC05374]TDF39105.1 TauD/TfdA family dioxygenase [Streptomyces sp. WAC05374]TDF47472.1 TauD/TfdA family dioxygenase [Streptomyces sp. WAC05374]TDF48213.1 TauD/TfdA family dioxygenase [Streptomyces sp. WAC05374]